MWYFGTIFYKVNNQNYRTARCGSNFNSGLKPDSVAVLLGKGKDICSLNEIDEWKKTITLVFYDILYVKIKQSIKLHIKIK